MGNVSGLPSVKNIFHINESFTDSELKDKCSQIFQ